MCQHNSCPAPPCILLCRLGFQVTVSKRDNDNPFEDPTKYPFTPLDTWNGALFLGSVYGVGPTVGALSTDASVPYAVAVSGTSATYRINTQIANNDALGFQYRAEVVALFVDGEDSETGVATPAMVTPIVLSAPTAVSISKGSEMINVAVTGPAQTANL
jgi:hypothetical protein